VCATTPVPPPAAYGIHPLDAVHRAKMTGVSWHPGCPVALDALSLVTVPYLDPEGVPHAGEIIIGTQHAPALVAIFRELYESHFPIARMEPVDAFGGDDQRSMAANNTSGFNCRPGHYANEWSQHALANAVDLNPLWNPQLRDEWISPPAGRAWMNRVDVRPGMAVRGGTAVTIFRSHGWRWGGRWPKPKDYQHFSASGR